MPHSLLDLEAVEAEIGRIRALGLDALRSLWRTTYRSSPPSGFTKELIARFLCWHIQEQACGGLDPKTTKHLASLARGDRSRAERPRRLKPGTVLVREYQGERHTVTVVANGFVWREATYASLSTIARAITGTNWNGPRFFGLRIDKESTISPEKADAPPRFSNGGTLAQVAASKSRRAVARGRRSKNSNPAHSSLGDGESGR
jgi:Protein of unknown function (DUF2924)